MRQRMAGAVTQQPGFFEQLGDNSYTRGWSELVSKGLRPVDRMVASDEELRRALAVPFGAGYSAGGAGNTEVQALLQALDPQGRLALQQRLAERGEAGVEELMARGGGELSRQGAAEALFMDTVSPLVGRQALQAGLEQAQVALPVSGAGRVAHAALGNAAAAYGLPLAGVGMASWAVADLMAAQQRQQKESQLPLQ